MSRPTDEERSRGFLRAPLLFVSVSFALGIATVDAPHAALAWTLENTPALLALAGAAMFAGLILARRQKPALAEMAAFVGFVLAGSIAAHLFEFRFPPRDASHLEDSGIELQAPVRIVGRIASSPTATAYGSQFDLDLETIDAGGRTIPMTGIVRVWVESGWAGSSTAAGDSARLKYGDSIRALTMLERPTEYRDPGVFNFRRWMASVHDIYWVGRIKSPSQVEKLPGSKQRALDELFARARKALLDGIDRLYPPWTLEGRYGSVLKAVLLGDRSSLDSSTIERFRVTGLYHLLVISGLHVGLLALLAAMLLRFTPLSELWRSALVLVFLLAYCSLVEMRAPTIRATIMIAAYLLARFFYREHAGLNSVGVAALVLLVARPPWLFEAGFDLSFAAALLIVGFVVPILERTLEPYRRALRNVGDLSPDLSMLPRAAQFRLDVRRTAAWLEGRIRGLGNHPAVAMAAVTWPLRAILWAAGMIVFTAILQIGLMLPLAATFHRVTFAGIGLNALAIPVMVFLLAVAVPTVLVSAVWPALAAWPAKILTLVMRALFFLTDLPHLPPWLSYRVPTPPAWLEWAFAISIVSAAFTLGRHRRLFWTAVCGVLLLAGIISTSPYSPQVRSGQLEVTAIDCGAGDSFLVVLPDRTTMLIDAGDRGRGGFGDPFESRRWDAGEDIVSPYLWSRQIKKIDIVVMSQGRPGELPGFAAIVRNFQVGELWRAADLRVPRTLEFLDELERRGMRVRAVAAGDRFNRGSSAVQILGPPRADGEMKTDLSAAEGLVLKIADGDSAFLFASTLDGRVARVLSDSGAPLQAGVIATTHFDPAASTKDDFMGGSLPNVALLSGESGGNHDSSHSRPDSELHWPGLALYRTDLDGAITVEMRGREVAVRTY
jgi:competence protein ComEC